MVCRCEVLFYYCLHPCTLAEGEIPFIDAALLLDSGEYPFILLLL